MRLISVLVGSKWHIIWKQAVVKSLSQALLESNLQKCKAHSIKLVVNSRQTMSIYNTMVETQAGASRVSTNQNYA